MRDVLRDPRFAAPAIPPSPNPVFQLLARWMIRLDGNRHRRVRDAFGGLFSARRVGRYRAIIAARAAALIDQAVSADSMDLVTGFARPLPFTVINDVLGVPPGDRAWLGEALAILNQGFSSHATPTAPRSRAPTTRPDSCCHISPGCSTGAPQRQPMT